SVADYVKTTLAGGSFAPDRVTPPKLIEMLERDNREALRLVSHVDTSANASLMYEVADVKTWAYLGLHLAEKLRGALALATFRSTGAAPDKQQAIDHLQKAVAMWDQVIQVTRP